MQSNADALRLHNKRQIFSASPNQIKDFFTQYLG